MKRGALSVICVAVALVACGAPGPASTAPTVRTSPTASLSALAEGSTTFVHPDVRVIVGVDADHTAIVEQLVEVRPPDRGVPAVVHLAVGPESDEPMMLGIEGAIGFLAAYAPDGSVVLDQIVELEGDRVELPGEDYVLRAYYRPCDGNCGLLDPPMEFCDIDVTLVAGGQYDVRVSFVNRDVSHCEFQQRPS